MNKEEISKFAEAYIEHYSSPHVWNKENVLVERDNSSTQWAEDLMFDITYENPKQLLEIILVIIHRDPPNEVVEILAAGPLEDYLAKCGEEVMSKVEEQAKRDKKFRGLLGGVWQNAMSDNVWARVQACWDRSGWDNGA